MKKILLIEDTLEMHKVIRSNLSARGYTVEIAASGEEGLKQVQEFHPDLVLLDIRLPGISGWEVLAALKRDPQNQSIPVILMTASEGQDHSQRAYEMGAAWYTTKPFKLHEFLAHIQNALQSAKPE
jgi:DNA-binding response OmpR family regulator